MGATVTAQGLCRAATWKGVRGPYEEEGEGGVVESSLDSAGDSLGDSGQAHPPLAFWGLCFRKNKMLFDREGDLESVQRKDGSLDTW